MKKTTLTVVLAVSCVSILAAAPKAYDSIVKKYAAEYGFDPLLIHAQIKKESGHNASICSGAGACGLMQIMPGTAPEVGVKNRSDPDQSVKGGTLYLRRLTTRYKGVVPHALYAYNWGAGNFNKALRGKKKLPKETSDYVPKIAEFYWQYGGKGNYFSKAEVIMGNSPAAQALRTKLGKGGGGAGSNPNPNAQKIEAALASDKLCPKPQLPEQQGAGEDSLPVIPVPPAAGGGEVVFDPAKVAKWVMAVKETKDQLEKLKGQYDAMTKGLAGLGLLNNVASLAGYEVPNIYELRDATVQWGKKFDNNLYQQLAEMKAANTGVYDNDQLTGLVKSEVQALNHSYVQSELAWFKVNCAASNMESLATGAGNTKTWKQARDLNNALEIENGILVAGQAQIRANMVAMQSRFKAFKLMSEQAYRRFIDGREKRGN